MLFGDVIVEDIYEIKVINYSLLQKFNKFIIFLGSNAISGESKVQFQVINKAEQLDRTVSSQDR